MLPDDYVEPVKLEKNYSGKGVNGNLIPPVAGEVRNPNGRPKGSRNRSTILRELMDIDIDGVDLRGISDKYKVEVLVNQALVKKAIDGDINAIKELQDTLYGKLTDKKEHVITTKAEQLSDDQLAVIASGSGEGIIEAPESTEFVS